MVKRCLLGADRASPPHRSGGGVAEALWRASGKNREVAPRGGLRPKVGRTGHRCGRSGSAHGPRHGEIRPTRAVRTDRDNCAHRQPAQRDFQIGKRHGRKKICGLNCEFQVDNLGDSPWLAPTFPTDVSSKSAINSRFDLNNVLDTSLGFAAGSARLPRAAHGLGPANGAREVRLAASLVPHRSPTARHPTVLPTATARVSRRRGANRTPLNRIPISIPQPAPATRANRKPNRDFAGPSRQSPATNLVFAWNKFPPRRFRRPGRHRKNRPAR